MAAVNHISLGTYKDGLATASVVFNLNIKAPQSHLYSDLDGWEVELREGYSTAVARTMHDFVDGELHERAIDVTGKALDIAAVMDFDALLLAKPGDDLIIYRCDKRVQLTIQSLLDFSVSVGGAGITITHADGTQERPMPQIPEWCPAFRFYRLSQASNDLFEAYRNLFLALEALLDQLFPKQLKEQEFEWLHRAFREVETHVDFALSQEAADPLKELVQRLYGIRLNLFHAKQGKTFVPEVGSNYLAVSNAYHELVPIWRKIVEKFLGASPRGGALMRAGFRMMMEPFADLHVAMSPDTTPVTKEDIDFSPSGKEVYIFERKVSMTEDRPGRMLFASHENIEEKQFATIGRLGMIMPDGTPAIGSDEFGEIDLRGVEDLEVRFLLRLINKKQPRTEF